MASIFNLRETQARIKRIALYLPGMMGNTAVNFFLDRFRFSGWVSDRYMPWAKRKGKTGLGRALMIKSGRLRRSIRITSNSGGVVRIGTDVPYAKALNEGFKGTVVVRAHTRHTYLKAKVASGRLTKKGKQAMKTVTTINGTYPVKSYSRKIDLPSRRFMGDSPFLRKRLLVQIREELQKAKM